MNRSYRHVWSQARQCWVVAAETATSRGSGALVRGRAVLAALLASTAWPALAQIVPSGGNTAVYRAPNGVQVVDIQTANPAGVSHNRYTNYNVEAAGVVLNNANSSQMMRNSVLAGQVVANLNLSNEATLIINEVVSNNRSVLQGYTEVLGGRASVVVANPWGITCQGCGFINTDRAVLSTGVPQIGGGGTLDALRVTMGDILVSGSGLDGSTVSMIDLVARSVKIDGRLSATDLGISTGAQDWNYTTRSASPMAGSGDLPLFAFDSTLLGGMYANRIRIVATDAGVGVRMLGEAAASADDFSLDAAGRITINSRVSAQRDLALAQNTQTSSDALAVAGVNASLTAGRDLRLDASSGGVTLTDANLSAGRNLTLQAVSLSDVTTTPASAGSRAAAAALDIEVSGTASTSISRWTSGGSFVLEAGNVQLGTGGSLLSSGSDTAAADRSLRIVATLGDIALATGKVSSGGNMILDALRGTVAVGSGVDQDVLSAADLHVSAATTLSNSGKLGARRDIVIRASDAGRTLAVTNSGTIQADRAIDLGGTGGASPARNVTLTNQASGRMLAGGALGLVGAQLTNSGLIQGAGTMTLTLDGMIRNTSTGKILEEGAGFSLSLMASTMENAGVVQSKGGLSIDAGMTISQVATGRTLTVAADQGGTNGALQIKANDVVNRGTFSSGGLLRALAQATLTNTGFMQSLGEILLRAFESITQAPSGRVIGSSSVTLASASLDNAGRVQAATDLTLGTSDARMAILNSESGVLMGNTVTVWTTTLQNSGILQATTVTNLDVEDDLVVASTGQIILSTAENAPQSSVRVGGTISNEGSISGSSAYALSVDTLTLSGQWISPLDITLTVAQTLTVSGTVQTGGVLDLTVGGLVTQSGSQLIAAGDIRVHSPLAEFSFENAGLMQAGAQLSIGDANHRADLVNAAGGELRGDSLALYATDLVNASGARMQWSRDGLINAHSLTNVASDSVIIGSVGDGSGTPYTSSYAIAGTLDNAGVLHSGGDAVISAGAIANQLSGGLSALRDLSAQATLSSNGAQAVWRNAGAVYAGRDLSLQATNGSLINAGVAATWDAAVNLTASAADLINEGAVRASTITLSGSHSFVNQLAGGALNVDPDAPPVSTSTETTLRTAQYNCVMGACDRFDEFETLVTLRQSVSGSVLGDPGQILADDTLNISYGAGGGANRSGVLSGQTVNISGSGSFTNEDLSLAEIVYAQRRAQLVLLSGSVVNYFPATLAQFGDTPIYDGTQVTWGASGPWSGSVGTVRQERSRSSYASSGAGIFAVNLNYTGGSLINAGAPKTAAVVERLAMGTAPSSASFELPTAATASGPQSVSADAGVALDGFTITLPSNPNGYFVTAQNPASAYLIETNPMYLSGSKFVGSDYLARRLGYNPDTLQQRLGDANYEAQLIRKQLIAQTGRNLVVQSESEATQMQRLMDNGAAAATRGLVYGQAPTPEQLAGLQTDIVWMVETEVGGQRVLAPVVYLSQATRDALDGTVVISATDAEVNATSVDNTGATLSGTGNLSVTTSGDITNTSGTVSGGQVDLNSTAGSVVNQTQAKTQGDAKSAQTSVGTAASIQATGSLSVTANKDITVQGASVTAAQDASLTAGGAIKIDTVVDQSATSAGSVSLPSPDKPMTTNASTTTQTQLGSTVSAGGDAVLKSGADTTIGGSQVTAGAALTIEAGGNLNTLAREDTTTSQSTTVAAPLARTQTAAGQSISSDKRSQTGEATTEVTSTLSAGGDITRSAGGTLTDQGTQLRAGGNITQSAAEVREIEATNTSVITTSATSISGSQSSTSGSPASTQKQGQSSSSSSSESSSQAVTTSYQAGGSVTSTSTGKTTLLGTQITAEQDVNVTAGTTLDYQAGNDSTTKSATSSVSAGQLTTNPGGVTGLDASVSTSSSSSSESIRPARTGAVTAGGDINLKSGADTTLTGTNLQAGDAVTLSSGGNTNLKAARDTTKTSQSSLSAGVAVKTSAKTASANLSVKSSGSSSDKARTSTIQAGAGGVSISAKKNVTLEGTQVRSGGAATVKAGGKVETLSATSKSSSYQLGTGVVPKSTSTSTTQAVDIQAKGKKTVAGGQK